MSELLIDGHTIPLDKDGYLQELGDWSPTVAHALAAREELELLPEHWEILDLLRDFYTEFQLSPANRPLVKYVALKLGPEKGNSLHLNRLFKGAPAKLAAKLAGLPKPTNCL
ncbi:TusE/DsrC/DsvC family sulfur relay protein [Pseudomonas sp. Q1-7]|uniref:TusE/DsrC/DsvC family sulfur relay protein n=1 Tax=Pseudomonas sp. Q1-7 TaxID=3020843 RepID=UPI002300745F|nr:TusE/DsrC/DsvC family sulfur relay protein [Pseudomonas sp. Q1-7]